MFQYETTPPKDFRTTKIELPEDTVALSHRAFLAWGEHCVECAMPACYESCDLFDATPSEKCRRFEGGLVRNRTADRILGSAEVRFKKWAKLESQGNVRMLPTAAVNRYERLLMLISGPAAWAGRLLHRFGAAKRWMWAEEALHKRMIRKFQAEKDPLRPNLFLAEITNPGVDSVALMLTAYIDKRRMTVDLRSDQLPPAAIIRIEAPAGFSRHELEIDSMRQIFESGLPFNLSLVPEREQKAHLVFHRLDLGIKEEKSVAASETAQSILPQKPAKLVIFDLDNTLWKGVLLEGEVEPVPKLRELFKWLDERGILISIASKNAQEDALSKLDELGLGEFLLYPQIGWNPKSEGINRIVKAIDIASDTVIFVDDNPFERAEVAVSVPGIEVLSETAVATLKENKRLQGSATPEARRRRKMYQQSIERNSAQSAFGDDYLSFLNSCEIVTTIRQDTPDDFDRIVELVQRTNQLNFSGRKYSREETARLLSDQTRERYLVECSDKFGSYGTVGFALVTRKEQIDNTGDLLIIDDFMLSCRVQGKFIEQALLHQLAQHGPRPVGRIRVVFRKTDRNKAAQMVLEKLGFSADKAGGAHVRKYSKDDFAVNFMKICTD